MSMTKYEARAEREYELRRRRVLTNRWAGSGVDYVDPVCEYCDKSFCGTDEEHLAECSDYNEESE